jgi:hypothetical protein
VLALAHHFFHKTPYSFISTLQFLNVPHLTLSSLIIFCIQVHVIKNKYSNTIGIKYLKKHQRPTTNKIPWNMKKIMRISLLLANKRFMFSSYNRSSSKHTTPWDGKKMTSYWMRFWKMRWRSTKPSKKLSNLIHANSNLILALPLFR